MRSIKFFLVSGILATLILFNFIAALQGYQSSMDEADRLFDNQMLDLARLVSNLDFTHPDVDEVRLGNDLTFQVWEGSALVAASNNAPDAPILEFSPGFEYANFNGYRWRTFTRFDNSRDRWVIVAERTDLRFVLAENVVIESVIPMLLGIPLVGLLIWVIVAHGLRPLAEFSAELKQKRANDLTPVLSANSRVELDQTIESVNGFIARLSTTMERESRFSADAAHELRTPISALKVQLHNLSRDIDTSNDSYQQLQQGVERMQHLLEQLLALYRTTPEQFESNSTQVDLYAITQQQIALRYPAFEAKQQQIELEGAAAVIVGDKFALETLLSNLLLNANKYTPVGGRVNVRVETGIQSGLQSTADEICLTVEDNGPGIPPQDRKAVFERFHRGSSAIAASETPGCGLGLTIVQHITELHNARVTLEDSSFASGCAFRIYFGKQAKHAN